MNRITQEGLDGFIHESNLIEDVVGYSLAEFNAYQAFLELPEVTVEDVANLVNVAQPGALLRDSFGRDVYIGDYTPPPGGQAIKTELECILKMVVANVRTPLDLHLMYEKLHPFMDGNGRSGRALWAWQMLHFYTYDLNQGFLEPFYRSVLREY